MHVYLFEGVGAGVADVGPIVGAAREYTDLLLRHQVGQGAAIHLIPVYTRLDLVIDMQLRQRDVPAEGIVGDQPQR